MGSSGRKAEAKPEKSPVKAPSPARARPQTVTFSRAVPLRSMSDVDPFMRVKRPYN